jgi:hypothetical protein
VLVTEGTIEEGLLKTLASKHDLALAALDADSDVAEVDFISNMEELKRKLEVLVGSQAAAPEDVTSRAQAERDVKRFGQRRERVAAAGGELLGAAFNLLSELVADGGAPQPSSDVVTNLRDRLGECVEPDEDGRQRLSITLPDRAALDNLATTLARLLAAGDETGT